MRRMRSLTTTVSQSLAHQGKAVWDRAAGLRKNLLASAAQVKELSLEYLEMDQAQVILEIRLNFVGNDLPRFYKVL